MKKLFLVMIVIALLAGLSACGTVEMPEEAGGADKMRKSPCACVRLEHNNGGFRWVS